MATLYPNDLNLPLHRRILCNILHVAGVSRLALAITAFPPCKSVGDSYIHQLLNVCSSRISVN